MEDFKTLKVEFDAPSGVVHLILNRPSQRNALDNHFFTEFPRLLSVLDENPSVRIVILKGSGKHFCSGADLSTLSSILTSQGEDHGDDDQGRAREKLRRSIKHMQAAISAVEECRKPVIASVHGGCIGAGVDLITACDMRYCSEDAFFSVKEVDLAITADLGTLQRLPRLVGDGNARELALTGRRVDALEAKNMGLVQNVYPTKSDMDEKCRQDCEGYCREIPACCNRNEGCSVEFQGFVGGQGFGLRGYLECCDDSVHGSERGLHCSGGEAKAHVFQTLRLLSLFTSSLLLLYNLFRSPCKA